MNQPTILLLHGDNLVSSRDNLKELVDQAKGKGQELIRLNGLIVKPEDLIQALDSASLFMQTRVVVIEELFSRPKSFEREQIFKFLKNLSANVELIFWEKKELGKLVLNDLPQGTQIKLFKTPVLVFKFLDQLSPQTKNKALELYHQLLKQTPVELVFYMICRQIRLLLLAGDRQMTSGPPWMIGKFSKQASLFSKDKLLTIYRELFRIEKSIKTGKTQMPLDWHLDLLILSL